MCLPALLLAYGLYVFRLEVNHILSSHLQI